MVTSSKGPPNDTNKVGPGNPPKEYRWKPGCPSPNPHGRPPSKKREMAVAPVDKMAELIERVGGMMTKGVNPVEYREFAVMKLYEIAVAKDDADPSSRKAKVSTADRIAAIKLLGEYERESARVLSEGRQQQFNAALDYKERWTGKFHAAEKAGRQVPSCLPHPDDLIVHTPSGRVSIVGPITRAEQIELEERLVLRDEVLEYLRLFYEKAATPENKKLVNKLRKTLRGFNKILPPRLNVEVPPPLR